MVDSSAVSASIRSLFFLTLIIVFVLLVLSVTVFRTYHFIQRRRVKDQKFLFVPRPFFLRTDTLESRGCDLEKGPEEAHVGIDKSKISAPVMRFGTGAFALTKIVLYASKHSCDFAGKETLTEHVKILSSNNEEGDDNSANDQQQSLQLTPILSDTGGVVSHNIDQEIKTLSSSSAIPEVKEISDLSGLAQSAALCTTSLLVRGIPIIKDGTAIKGTFLQRTTVQGLKRAWNSYDDDIPLGPIPLDNKPNGTKCLKEETSNPSLDTDAHNESSSSGSLSSCFSTSGLHELEGSSSSEKSAKSISPFDDKFNISRVETHLSLTDTGRGDEPSSLVSLSSTFSSLDLHELDTPLTSFEESAKSTPPTYPSHGILRPPCISPNLKEAAGVALFLRRILFQRDPDVRVLVLNPTLRDPATFHRATVPDYSRPDLLRPESIRKEIRCRVKCLAKAPYRPPLPSPLASTSGLDWVSPEQDSLPTFISEQGSSSELLVDVLRMNHIQRVISIARLSTSFNVSATAIDPFSGEPGSQSIFIPPEPLFFEPDPVASPVPMGVRAPSSRLSFSSGMTSSHKEFRLVEPCTLLEQTSTLESYSNSPGSQSSFITDPEPLFFSTGPAAPSSSKVTHVGFSKRSLQAASPASTFTATSHRKSRGRALRVKIHPSIPKRSSSGIYERMPTVVAKPESPYSSQSSATSKLQTRKALSAPTKISTKPRPFVVSNAARDLTPAEGKDPKPTLPCLHPRARHPVAASRQGSFTFKASNRPSSTRREHSSHPPSSSASRASSIRRDLPVARGMVQKVPTPSTRPTKKMNIQNSENSGIGDTTRIFGGSPIGYRAKRRALSDISGPSLNKRSTKCSESGFSQPVKFPAPMTIPRMSNPSPSRKPSSSSITSRNVANFPLRHPLSNICASSPVML